MCKPFVPALAFVLSRDYVHLVSQSIDSMTSHQKGPSPTTQAPAIIPQGKVYLCGLLRGCGYTQIVMRHAERRWNLPGLLLLFTISIMPVIQGCGLLNDALLTQRRYDKLDEMMNASEDVSRVAAILDTSFAAKHFGKTYFGAFNERRNKFVAFMWKREQSGTTIGYVYGNRENQNWKIAVINGTSIGNKIDSDGNVRFDHFKRQLVEDNFFQENSEALSQQFWKSKTFAEAFKK